jgi:hypothetical protein
MKKHATLVRTFCLCLCAGLAMSGFYLSTRHTRTEPAVIGISADGGLTLDGKRIELNQLRTRLKENTARGRSIAVQADKGAPFERIVEVMDAAKAASKLREMDDVRNPNVAAEPPACTGCRDSGLLAYRPSLARHL